MRSPFLLRRRFLGVTLALLIMAGIAAGTGASRASAFEAWCFDDPVLVVGGQAIHIDLGVPVGQRALIKGSTLVVTVPTNVATYLAGTTAYNFPITVTIIRNGSWSGSGSIPVTATGVVYGPAGVPTAIKAWGSSGTLAAMTTATTGTPMTVTLGVQPSFGSTTRTTSTARRTR
jgi:hypothetical protein